VSNVPYLVSIIVQTGVLEALEIERGGGYKFKKKNCWRVHPNPHFLLNYGAFVEIKGGGFSRRRVGGLKHSSKIEHEC
jgi:hypothetical protein